MKFSFLIEIKELNFTGSLSEQIETGSISCSKIHPSS